MGRASEEAAVGKTGRAKSGEPAHDGLQGGDSPDAMDLPLGVYSVGGHPQRWAPGGPARSSNPIKTARPKALLASGRLRSGARCSYRRAPLCAKRPPRAAPTPLHGLRSHCPLPADQGAGSFSATSPQRPGTWLKPLIWGCAAALPV